MISRLRLGLALILASACDPQATAAHGATELAPPAEMGPHCEMHKTEPSALVRSEAAYAVPALTLIRQDGSAYPLAALAEADRVVVLNFIFATCTTICPVMTATFAQARAALGADAARIQMVSITIDPQHDTPAVLATYAATYDAPADWAFLTGSEDDVNTVLHAFSADFGSKFNHRPVTLIHPPGGGDWIRLEGQGGGAELAAAIGPHLAPHQP